MNAKNLGEENQKNEKSSLKKVFDEDDAFDDDWNIEISENLPEPKKEKITTEDIRVYINNIIERARNKGGSKYYNYCTRYSQ